MGSLLFGVPNSGARRQWNANDFVDINDTIRGGSSSSRMRLVPDDITNTEKSEAQGGALEFSGFLDTTTLGGAGFASQAYQHPFPGSPLTIERYRGLRLTGRRLVAEDQQDSSSFNVSSIPGGGKAPVTTYVLNLKTEVARHRPDGRRESQITYEWTIDLSTVAAQGGLFDVQCGWHDFHATYRGRPAPDTAPLDPSKVQEWSIMARSNFGSQSGSFELRLDALSAVAIQHDEKQVSRQAASSPPSYVVAMEGGSSSGEFYGFALFIFATVAFCLWLVWAITPDQLLHRIGIDWYPNREWAFLLPAWSLFAVLFVYAAYMCLNTYDNADLSDLRQVVDSHSNLLPVTDDGRPHPLQGISSMRQTGGIDGPLANDIYEIPPGVVSRQRHGL